MKEIPVTFTSEGEKIVGILHVPDNSNSKAIVMVHGITVDKDESGMFVRAAKKFCKNDYTVLRFDFRGHGESDGDSVNLTIKGELSDLNEAVNFIESKGFKNISILAASFGGSITSIFAARNRKIKSLVMWYPLLNYDNVFLKPVTAWGIRYFSGENFREKIEKFGYVTDRKGFKIGKKLFDDMKKTKPYESLKKISCPMLIIHGSKDTYVPYKDSKKYYKLAENSKLETIEGADHGFDKNDSSMMKKVIQFSLDWFNKWLK